MYLSLSARPVTTLYLATRSFQDSSLIGEGTFFLCLVFCWSLKLLVNQSAYLIKRKQCKRVNYCGG